MEQLTWSIRWANTEKPPFIRIDVKEERKKQVYLKINKMMKGYQT